MAIDVVNKLKALAAGVGLAAALGVPSPAVADEIMVYAAASLTDVMEAVKESFEKVVPDHELVLVFGSSSTLMRQIEAGAPVDVFLSANKTYADLVAKPRDLRSEDMFGNRLVIIAPEAFEGEIALEDLPEALGDNRLAVGDPAHVPAGIYAQQALEAAGLWKELENHLAPAGDVRGAVALVETGAAPFGIVYKTDAAMEGVKIVGMIDDDLHDPIRYWGVALTEDPGGLLLTYMASFDGQNLIDYFGFQTVITPKD